MVDKVIVSNRQAMGAKYGSAGLPPIDAALAALVAADAKRGLTTRIINIDDAGSMTAFGAQPMLAPADEPGAKAAVDAIYTALTPDYIMLLDGPDVIPHVTLDRIPGLTDDDPNVPSDLPYACSAAFSRSAGAFVGVDRVVGRLPAAEGETNSQVLVTLLQHAAAQQPQAAAQYMQYFGLSAEVWEVSTKLSLNAAFSSSTALQVAPPAASPAINPSLGALAHFINCHGANASPSFYGQHGDNFPVAVDSAAVAANANAAGTVVAAECCYGGQLYNYALAGTAEPICLAYLRSGAAAFVGSSTIAYGPSDANAQADLLCQFFWQIVLTGASTGRALLQARQQFIRSQTMSEPNNLKTLAQFLLLGDPSVVPATAAAAKTLDPGPALGASLPGAGAAQRKLRRVALASTGKAVGEAASLPGGRIEGGTPTDKHFAELATARGYAEFSSFEVTGGAQFRQSLKALHQRRRAMVAVLRNPRPVGDKSASVLPFVHVLIGHVVDDTIVSINECESR